MNRSMTKDKENTFGINERDYHTIQAITQKYAEVKEVQLFGSRAKGNFKFRIDIDFAVMDPNVSQKTMANLLYDFEESSLPYRVDLVNYYALNHKNLIDHIDRVEIVIYGLNSKENL